MSEEKPVHSEKETLHKTRILVTGSNGLLGQKITDLVLKQPDIHLIATSRGADRHPAQGVGYTYVDVDLLDEDTLLHTIQLHRPEIIIHAAAMTQVDACEEDPVACRRQNVDVVKELVRHCEAHQIHLIHLSTDFIFDGLNGPYKEEDQPQPLSYYGQSKWESEQIVRNNLASWTIIRTILVYGIVADMSRSNIVLWAKKALENDQPIQVVNDQWRMPTWAEDLAQACLTAARNRTKGVFHICGEEFYSVWEMVHEIASFWQLDRSLIQAVSTDTLRQKAPRPAKTGFILDKAKAQLQYRPTPFREALAAIDQQLQEFGK